MCIVVITSDPIPLVIPSTRSCFSSPDLAHAFHIRRGRPYAARREEEAHALRRRRGRLAGAQRHGRGLAGTGQSPARFARRSICHCLYPCINSGFVSFLVYICSRSVRYIASWATARVSINQDAIFRVVILLEDRSSIFIIMRAGWLHWGDTNFDAACVVCCRAHACIHAEKQIVWVL